MPKTSIDQLVAAVQAVKMLEEAIASHERAILSLIETLETIKSRLLRLERACGLEPS